MNSYTILNTTHEFNMSLDTNGILECTPKPRTNQQLNILKHSFINKLRRSSSLDSQNGSYSSGPEDARSFSPYQNNVKHPNVSIRCQQRSVHGARRACDRYARQYPVITPERVQVRSFTSLTPLPVYDVTNEEVLCDECALRGCGHYDNTKTNKSAAMDTAVDEALQKVKEGRKMRLKDKLTGVSRDKFLESMKGKYEIYNDDYDLNRLLKHELPILSRQSTFSQLERSKYREEQSWKLQNRKQKVKVTSSPPQPISANQSYIKGHVNIPEIGVHWSIPPSAPRFQTTSADTPEVESRLYDYRIDSGQLYRNSYPVTEALHREGTSVSMSMGRALTPGEVDIYKVWPRRLDERILLSLDPVFIAKQDTTCSTM